MNEFKDYISYEGGKIYFIEKRPEIYEDKIILLYGETGSGKTHILVEILHLLKDRISIPLVFSPTNFADSEFDGMIPPECIYDNVDIKKLEDIWNTQGDRTIKYKIANDLCILKSLFDRVASQHDMSKADRIVSFTRRTLQELNYNTKLNMGSRRSEKLFIEKQRNKSLIRLYKEHIKSNRNNLLDMDLDKQELIAINFLDMNPRIVLIFDDCMSTAKEWSKTEVVKKLFYTGRKYFITQIYTLQDDHGIPPDLRKNGMFSIFTSSNLASIYFETTSNGITSQDKKDAKKIINVVFREKRGAHPHYQKLVYDKTKADKFMYTVADEYDDFRIGSSYAWKYTDKLPKKDGFLRRRTKMEFLY